MFASQLDAKLPLTVFEIAPMIPLWQGRLELGR